LNQKKLEKKRKKTKKPPNPPTRPLVDLKGRKTGVPYCCWDREKLASSKKEDRNMLANIAGENEACGSAAKSSIA